MGPNASSDYPHFGANFWEDWEKPIFIEVLETDETYYSSPGWSKNLWRMEQRASSKIFVFICKRSIWKQ